LNSETSRYMFRILAIKEIYTNARRFGFALDSTDYYPVIETYTINVDSTVDNLAKFAIDKGINYKVLKLMNPWLRQNYLKNKARKTYVVSLPVDKSFIEAPDAAPAPAVPTPEDEKPESIE
ncbi:MAG TPA: lytic transglycosylase domain-containing protein, partial [Bacteroidia bacterium]|nr:lytic transglycosylase domain-containing protein [Bacteroidia bacterium]